MSFNFNVNFTIELREIENHLNSIVSKEIKAEIGEIIFLSNFLAKRVKSQRGRN
jgi:hypothetical protein